MPDRDARVEGGQGGAQHGRGIPLDEHDVGVMAVQPAAHGGHDATGELGQGLAWLHEVEVMVGFQPERPKRLIEHLPMLGGGDQYRAELRRLAQGEVV